MDATKMSVSLFWLEATSSKVKTLGIGLEVVCIFGKQTLSEDSSLPMNRPTEKIRLKNMILL